jgi:nucleoid DNA-binding protein
MDKPVTLSVKAWIIRQMSIRTMTSERVIETVVNHQFDSALSALDNCNSLEFSGFGKLFFNIKKAHKKLEKMNSQIREFTRIVNDESTGEIRRKRVEFKLNATVKNFDILNAKLNGCTEDLRRVEESSFSIEADEGDYPEGE